MEERGYSPKILLVDDEDSFRLPLAERLSLRGFQVRQASGGDEAVRLVRLESDIEVVLLDKKMPGMDGTKTLREIKAFRPEIQVIMLTGFGSVDSATEMGKLGVFRYLAKPTPMDELVLTIRAAAREKVHALAKQDMPSKRYRDRWSRFFGSQNLRPIVILLGLVILSGSALLPIPEGMTLLLGRAKSTDLVADPIGGYSEYMEMEPGQTIAGHYVGRYRPPGLTGSHVTGSENLRPIARRALLMIGLIMVAAMFWATSAVPMGITALVVAVVMYAGGVMRPDGVAQAFAKDSVVFIFGVLVLSRVIMSTGLDRRIAMLLLMPVRNLPQLLFIFLPLFAMACSFISETILIALMMPIFVTVYRQVAAKGPDPRCLLVMFALMLCYSSNLGGPGSPAAGGRNAVMIGILADYGEAPTFLQWMKYGLPFVPVAALTIGLYFYFAFRWRIGKSVLNVAGIARQASDRLGPMNRDEYVTAGVSLLVIGLWMFGNGRLGMGGPVLLGLVLLNILGVMKWNEITKIHWDVVFLYAGASALGKGLAVTGGALYLARGFIEVLPVSLVDGSAFGGALGSMGLPMAVSLVTGLVTNIMSDGATVSAVGPIAVPMAQNVGIHPWALGFAVAFSSSFPHMLIIGTPANALVYILCRDPNTGRQLVTQGDFLKHGLVVFLLSFLVLWGWAFLGYWRWLGF
ncbi:MAG: anion permease [Gemmatimonadales bacterium]|nr:anion permease [Gemmatimonadales bacterium]